MGRKLCGTGSPGIGVFLAASLLWCAVGVAQVPDAAVSALVGPVQTAAAGQTPGQKAQAVLPGQVSGTVVDADADVVGNAEVTLSREGVSEVRKTQTGSDGRFQYNGVPPGKFKVTVRLKGMAPVSLSGLLHAGEIYETPSIRLDKPEVEIDVQVVASQSDLAEAEIKVEEHQRLVGFLPNFFVAYDWHAAPLSTRQKFELAWKNAIDPGNALLNAGVAGVEQAQNTFPGYGQGAAGYGKRFGAASGDLLAGTMLGGAVFPTLFKQDPRYFYKGTGTVKSRLYYALSRAVICRGDNGKWQPAYASMLGDLSAGAVTNLYVPASSRDGAGLTLGEGFLNIAGDALGNVVQEFVLRRLTPHAPSYGVIGTP
jgi:hypothetical protein